MHKEKMLNILDFDRKKLQEILTTELGLEKFRADQMFRWIYKERVKSFDAMTDIAKSVREKLTGFFEIKYPNIHDIAISQDGTRKFIFKLEDDELIESVLIKQPKRMTVCISSQVGCAMGCKFCRTATLGFKRNLTAGEIIGQVLALKDEAREEDFYNIVFMGMGEPLNNIGNLLTALAILSDDHGLCFSERKLTVSTAGVVPNIALLGSARHRGNLAISLNATTDKVRSAIMPINQKYPLEQLIGALRAYPLTNRQRITIEYVLLKGVNDSIEDRKRFKKLLHGISIKVNLIPYNSNTGLGFEQPSRDVITAWQEDLLASKINSTVRWSKGNDISAACGQLLVSRDKMKPK